MTRKFSDDDFRAEAKQVWESEGEIEIDDNAVVSQDEDSDEPVYGAYVAAWVWVEFDEDDESESDLDPDGTMTDPHACDQCGTVYDEAGGDGYQGLCPSCADATEPTICPTCDAGDPTSVVTECECEEDCADNMTHPNDSCPAEEGSNG